MSLGSKVSIDFGLNIRMVVCEAITIPTERHDYN